MSKMYLMCGCPGAGKSYYIKTHLKEGEKIISRDEIRFSMLKEEDEYFSKEKEVYNEFIKQINAAIADNKDFYVDQTSLNAAARNKLFNKLIKKPDKIIGIYFTTPIDIILQRNAQRNGRALVPENVVFLCCKECKRATPLPCLLLDIICFDMLRLSRLHSP